MPYFAYGSNLSTARLRQRVASARPLAVASLPRHRLAFHKIGRDGSAKCDARHTDDPRDLVVGVLFDVAADHYAALDAAEGRGAGYERDMVVVLTRDGAQRTAFTYRATHIDPTLLPFDWYLAHVLRGAAEHALPVDYLVRLRRVPSIVDPDPHRAARERSIYPD